MKKTVLTACVAVFALSAISILLYCGSMEIAGAHTKAYFRFFKTDESGKKTFNPWALISPIQFESQMKNSDTAEITTAVGYPLAPKFTCVSPTGIPEEVLIANQIAKQIADTIASVMVYTLFDYDNTSRAVRKNVNPNTPLVNPSRVIINLEGTASPEAAKYGFMNSVQPGNLEKENASLAKQRLDRTSSLLLQKLHTHGIDKVVLSKKSYEKQFSHPMNDSIEVVKKLDAMRYVSANVSISMERVDVSLITAPILLPIWLGLITLLISYLLGLRFKRSEKEEEKVESFPIDWMQLFKVLGATLLVSIILTVFMMMLPHIAKYLAIVIGVLIAGITVYAIISMIRTVSVAALWNGAKELVSLIFVWILRAISWIILVSIIYVSNAYEWWKAQTTCRKVLLVHFFIDFIILVTWLLGWWHVC